MDYKCFYLEKTDKVKVYFRRYCSQTPGYPCRTPDMYHNAKVFEGIHPVELTEDGYERVHQLDPNDPRWPTKCEECGYEFAATDTKQSFGERIWRRTDTGEEMTLREAPIGAMWDADWYPVKHRDGRYLIVKTPGGEWAIDSQCSNCTRPGQPHECWVRHGEPPLITVDKNGNTCAAGAGSIVAGSYHGFLRNGTLVDA